MNHIHRLVFNTSTNTWVAVAENTRGRGKGSSRKLVAAALSLVVGLAQAAPLGGVVASGTGSINQSGTNTTITQTTPNLTLNWKSFNIGAAESVKFVQPSASSVAVNRIYDTNGSQILGRLSANGQLYLINPNGFAYSCSNSSPYSSSTNCCAYDGSYSSPHDGTNHLTSGRNYWCRSSTCGAPEYGHEM